MKKKKKRIYNSVKFNCPLKTEKTKTQPKIELQMRKTKT